MFALTGHFHQPEFTQRQNLGLGTVVTDEFPHRLVDCLAVLGAAHVDEVDHELPADIAQAHLPRDLLRGFQIGLENRGILIFRAAFA